MLVIAFALSLFFVFYFLIKSEIKTFPLFPTLWIDG
jgi:hypothetical protein